MNKILFLCSIFIGMACSLPVLNETNEIAETKFVVGKNLTMDLIELQKSQKVLSKLNCNNSQFTCINGGVCKQFNQTFKCVCSSKFTGELCEIRINNSSIVSNIMSGHFKLDEFKENLMTEVNNTEITEDDMQKIKKLLKDSTHEEIMKYLRLFKKGELRYEILMNGLIETILEDIYPEAYFLSTFNATAENFTVVVSTLIDFVEYTKLSKDRYAEVFINYQQVLEKLVTILKSKWINVEPIALEYVRVTGLILNETRILERVFTHKKLSEKEMNEKLRNQFNETAEANHEFILKITELRDDAVELLNKKPELKDVCLSQINAPELQQQLTELFDEVAVTSAQIVSSLFSFGFWLVTDVLANVVKTN